MTAHTVSTPNNKQALVTWSPVESLHSLHPLSQPPIRRTWGDIGSTLGAATGLLRAGGMSTLHSLSEWRLTTCGFPRLLQLSPSGPVLLTVWDPRTATSEGAQRAHRCGIEIFPCSCTYGDTMPFLLAQHENPALLSCCCCAPSVFVV